MTLYGAQDNTYIHLFAYGKLFSLVSNVTWNFPISLLWQLLSDRFIEETMEIKVKVEYLLI